MDLEEDTLTIPSASAVGLGDVGSDKGTTASSPERYHRPHVSWPREKHSFAAVVLVTFGGVVAVLLATKTAMGRLDRRYRKCAHTQYLHPNEPRKPKVPMLRGRARAQMWSSEDSPAPEI